MSSPERAVVDRLVALRAQLLDAEPPPSAIVCGAHVAPRGVRWQELEHAIAEARAGRWKELNAIERKAAPECPVGEDPKRKWRIHREIKGAFGRLLGYEWVMYADSTCEECDGSGQVEAERPNGTEVDVDCDECDGTGHGEDLAANARVVQTDLMGYPTLEWRA